MARRKLSELVAEEAAKPKANPNKPNFLIDAGRRIAESGPIPAARFLGKLGLPMGKRIVENYEKDLRENPSPGTMGGVAGDMMVQGLPIGKIKGLAGLLKLGVQGAGIHQAQNYAKTGEVNPGDAALETALGAAAGGVGAKIPGFLKGAGVKSLEVLSHAPKRLESGMNPPTSAGFRQALDKRLVPIMAWGKGAFRKADERGLGVQLAGDAQKKALLAKEGVEGNLLSNISDAEAAIRSRSTGSKGLLPKQMEDAVDQLGQYDLAARSPRVGMAPSGAVSGEAAIEQGKMAGANSRWVEGKTPPGLDLASQEYYRANQDNLMRGMTGKPSEGAYRTVKKEMADLAPVLEAFHEKARTNYSAFPELIGTGTGIGAGLATGNLGVALAPVALAASRRYPGMAPLLYESGRGFESKFGTQAARRALDLGRAAIFSPEDN